MQQVTDDDFTKEVQEATGPVLVDFWAPWCGPCVALTPTIEQLADEYVGKVKIVKMNVDENPTSSASFGIRSIPALLFFKDGQVVQTLIGKQSKAKIKEVLDTL